MAYLTAMRFGKLTMYLILQGLMLLVLLLHLGRWVFSDTAQAQIIPPYSASTIKAQYTVEGVRYTGTYMRNEYPLMEKTITIRYLAYNPSKSRVNSFIGIAMESLAWWFVLTLGISALLLTNNPVFSKGTTFQLHQRFPWISMDEYFPIKSRWFYRGEGYGYGEQPPKGRSEDAGKRRLLK